MIVAKLFAIIAMSAALLFSANHAQRVTPSQTPVPPSAAVHGHLQIISFAEMANYIENNHGFIMEMSWNVQDGRPGYYAWIIHEDVHYIVFFSAIQNPDGSIEELERTERSISQTSMWEDPLSVLHEYSEAYITSFRHSEINQTAINTMRLSGSWDAIVPYLPYLSPEGADEVVLTYLDKQLHPGISTPTNARHVASTIEPALQYMSELGRLIAQDIIALFE